MTQAAKKNNSRGITVDFLKNEIIIPKVGPGISKVKSITITASW